MSKTRNYMRSAAKKDGFWRAEKVKTGKNKGRVKWVQIAQCTDAEVNAVMVICKQYAPDVPLQDVKTDLVKGAIRLLLDKLIDAGFTTSGDVQRSVHV